MNRFFLPYAFKTGRIVARDLPFSNTQPLDPSWIPNIDSSLAEIQSKMHEGQSREQISSLLNIMGNDPQTKVLNRLHTAVEQVARTEHKNLSQFGFTLMGQVTPQVSFAVGQMMADTQKAAEVAKIQLANDVRSLDDANRQIQQTNDQVISILTSFTGRDLGQDPEPWKKWWVEQLGYRYNLTSEDDKPTFSFDVPIAYQPTPIVSARTSVELLSFQRCSCFGAGTLVQTATGPRAIETLAVGDIVLTQSVTTGALGYQPILKTHHNPPSGTFRVKLGDDEIIASAFHRFWVAGRGWVMARNLQAGDLLRTLSGVQAVESVTAGKVELVYNLDVADDADFFAGTSAALVHDNTLPDPRLVPFDLPTPTTAVAAR